MTQGSAKSSLLYSQSGMNGLVGPGGTFSFFLFECFTNGWSPRDVV